MGIEEYVRNAKQFVKDNSRKIGFTTLTTATLFGASLLYEKQARAEDVLSTNDISTITAIDSDGDGLTNVEEVIAGTISSSTDSDNDGFNDGIEFANSYDPLSIDSPGLISGNRLFEFPYIQNLTTGTTNNALSPAWHLGGQRVSYIEADSSFVSGTLYSKNIFDLTRARRELETGLSAELRSISTGPLGLIDYFHKPRLIGGLDGIFKVGVGGFFPSSRAVPAQGQTLPENVNLRNPSIGATLSVNIGSATIEAVSEWLFAEADLPSSASGQIYAFKMNPLSGNWDESSPIKITNFTNRTARPRVSRDLDKIMFQEVDINGDNRLWVGNGLNGVLNNFDVPYELTDSLSRTSLLADSIGFSDGVSFPGGFSGRGEIVFFTYDTNNVYSLNDPLNFTGADFDIGLRGVYSSSRISIPLPGNQITPAVSHDGMRLAFADDYLSDGNPGGNFNLYVAGIKPLGRIIDGLDVSYIEGFTAPSGLTFEGNIPGHKLATPGGTPNILSVHSPLKPVADATSALSALTALTRYEPDGLEVEDPFIIGGTQGIYQTKPWGVEDLVTEDGGLLDENAISIGWEVEDATGNPVYTTLPEQYIVDRDLVNREIRFISPGFSTAKKKKFLKGLPLPTGSASYGLIAPKLIPEPLSAVENWQYMDVEDANPPVYGSYGNTNEGLNFTIQPYDSNALHERSQRKLEEKFDKPYVIDTEEFSIDAK